MSEREERETRPGSINFASRLLRGAIVVLMILVPLSAVYAFVFGGIAGAANADILYVHDFRGGPGAPFTLPVPPPPGAFAPFQFGTPGVLARADNAS